MITKLMRRRFSAAIDQSDRGCNAQQPKRTMTAAMR
jgi:hypothetical protein